MLRDFISFENRQLSLKIMLLILISTILICHSNPLLAGEYRSSKPSINASSGKVILEGPWEFYEAVEINPELNPFPEGPLTVDNIQKFSPLTKSPSTNYPISGKGTFLKTLIVDPGSPRTLMFFPGLYDMSLRVWILRTHDQRILAEANFGLQDFTKPIPTARLHPLSFYLPKATELTFILQVHNNLHSRGFLSEAPTIGPQEIISEEILIEALRDIGCAGVLIGMFIFNFLLWIHRPSNHPAGWSAVATMVALLRLISTDRNFLNIIPIEWTLPMRKVEYATIPAFSIFCVYLNSTFSGSVRLRNLIRWHVILGSLLVGFILFNPPPIYTSYLWLYQLHVIPTLAISLYITIRSAKNLEEGSYINLFGFLTILLFAINDIVIVDILKLSQVFLVPVGSAVFLILQCHVLARRAALDSQRAKILAEENVEIQRKLRIETEARFLIASDAAHRMNNPLNYIQQGIDNVKLTIKEIWQTLSSLFQDQESKEAQECQSHFQTKFDQIKFDLNQIDKGVEVSSHEIGKIRALSGVDGYATSLVPVNDVLTILQSNIFHRLSPEKQKQLKIDLNSKYSRFIYANRYMLLHMTQLFVEALLYHTEQRLDFVVETTEDQTGLKLYAPGHFLSAKEKLSELGSQMSLLSHPFQAEAYIEWETSGVTLIYIFLSAHKK